MLRCRSMFKKLKPAYCEDFNFADIHRLVDQRKLDDDVSEAKSTFVDVITLDSDRGSSRYSARILTTQSVVPQDRCVKGGITIGQTDNEVIRPMTYR